MICQRYQEPSFVCSLGLCNFVSSLVFRKSWRRRRRQGCNRRDCVLYDWSTFGVCSKTCGVGQLTQRRNIKRRPKCSGKRCPPPNSPQRYRILSCNTQCCRVNCAWSCRERLESLQWLRNIATDQDDAYSAKPKMWRDSVSE